jgi:phage tail-like protein
MSKSAEQTKQREAGREASRPKGVGCTVSHIADFYRRYPGETVTFHARLRISDPGENPEAGDRRQGQLALRISLPPGLILDDYRAAGAMPLITRDGEATTLTWPIGESTEGSSGSACHDYFVEARVAPTPRDIVLESRAIAVLEATGQVLSAESVAIAVAAHSQTLKYLPAIYQEDELMARFLMLFDSFWTPLERQIDHLPSYFDPWLTPPDFLPWLASWLSLVLDESWPEEKRRQLLRSAADLYRRRGTKQALEEYLVIYTGRKPTIVEHRAYNFRLGPESRLGPGVALGTGNVPYTFSVSLRLPPIDLPDEGDASPNSEASRPSGADEDLLKELKRRRQRKIEAIIDAEKPVHTSYTLHIETDSRGALPWSPSEDKRGVHEER